MTRRNTNYKAKVKAIKGWEIDIDCVTIKSQMFLDLFKSPVSVYSNM